METDPSFLFDFFLAERLHKTIGEIRAIPHREWTEWSIYFARKHQRQELENRKAR